MALCSHRGAPVSTFATSFNLTANPFSAFPKQAARFDEIDLTVADSPPQRRSERETDKLFSILDEIEKERRSA